MSRLRLQATRDRVSRCTALSAELSDVVMEYLLQVSQALTAGDSLVLLGPQLLARVPA